MSTPFQRRIFSGSTRNSQTVSGLASIRTSRSTEVCSAVRSIFSLLLSFDLAFEGRQLHVPELLEERLELGEALGARPVQASGAVSSFVHEPGLLQHGQMLGDRRTGDVEVRGDLARGHLVVEDESQNRLAT